MDVNVNVTVSLSESTCNFLTALFGGVKPWEVPDKQTEKKAPLKAVAGADKVAADVKPATNGNGAAHVATKELTQEDVRAVIATKKGEGKMPQMKAILGTYGVEKFPDLDKSLWAEFLEKISAL